MCSPARGFLHNRRFKHSGVFGNLFVGISAGMTFVFGGNVVGRAFEPIVWYLALTTLVTNAAKRLRRTPLM